jgi:GNAT superfamily N-acetyltransferase
MPEHLQEHVVTLTDGTRALVRPIQPDDKEKLLDGLERLSPESRYRRFMRPVASLTDRELSYLTEIDYHDHFAWAALASDLPGEPGLGIARYIRDPLDPEVAEAAVAVVDEYQGLGLGTILLRLLAATALAHGIGVFRAWVLPENRRVIEPLRRRGAEFHHQDGLVRIDVALVPAEEAADSALREALRAAAEGAFPEPAR